MPAIPVGAVNAGKIGEAHGKTGPFCSAGEHVDVRNSSTTEETATLPAASAPDDKVGLFALTALIVGGTIGVR